MAFFQNAVLNKYLKAQDALAVKAAYEKFKTHFHNPLIQENIRNSKEEQYQGEFLIDLFVNVLGYTKNPTPDFNLTTEYKNVKDSKKADGAIIINDKVLSVIELKGTDTTDLGKIETQAFGYKNNQPQCVYVVTSNFEKLRFYIDNAIEHIEFNLFTLTENDFQLLWLCLAYTNIEKGIPKKIKDESLGQEDIITKKLYNDYSLFKRELFQNLVALNPTEQPLELFKKSQKLLDRFLFLFFAEDRQLLPPNAVRNVMSEWKQLKELDEYKPLYEQFKKHFNYLNTGFKNNRYEIYAYGGGLFQADELLDSVKIDDDLLYRHTHKLSEYDFASEVDVNILGHIFENSLNELDEIKAQLAGEVIDKSKTKRKKDGVFYTPKYITKYIVENTVGKLCIEKKAELQLNEEEYTTDKKRQQKTRQALLDKLTAYRQWLLQLTICDPACGSGAFLNQALDFLINEHRYIDELQAKLFGDALVLSDMENSILENNLFGVDLNEESVEIAKLSLWLRTAQPNRKLNDLNNNIKCGNSLIDDPAVAGDKVFNWGKEFPQVFAKDGFDVVIGNPPYVLCQPSNTSDLLLNFFKTFSVASYKIDLFHLFFEKSIQILNVNGRLGFITPNTYLTNKFIKPLRFFILKNTDIESIILHEEDVFSDASVDVATIILNKNKKKSNNIKLLKSSSNQFYEIAAKAQTIWENEADFIFNVKEDLVINLSNSIKLGEICNTYFGIQAYDRKSSISEIKRDENFKEIIDGGDIYPYSYAIPNKYFNYKIENIKSGGDWNVYAQDRIVIRQIGQIPIVGVCKQNILASNTLYSIFTKDANFKLLYIFCILNSSVIKKYWLSKYSDSKQLFPKIKGYQIKELPIKSASISEQQPFIDKADQMLLLNKELRKVSSNFINLLQSKYSIEKPTTKLQNWYELEFGEFLKELKKAKVQLSLAEEAEWMSYFNSEKQKAQALKTQIAQTDKEIDRMVYELYGLTEEEIKIVENN